MSIRFHTSRRATCVLIASLALVAPPCAAEKARSAGPAHRGPVVSLAVSPDGKLAATGSKDKTIKIWSLADRRLLKTLNDHQGQVSGLAFTPDGATLISAGWDGALRLWSTSDFSLKKTIETGGVLYHVAVSPDGNVFAAGGKSKPVILYSLPDGAQIRTVPDSNDVFALAFSPDGRTLAYSPMKTPLKALGGGYQIRLFDVAGGEVKSSMKGHQNNVMGLIFDPAGGTLYSGSLDSAVGTWDLASGKGKDLIPGQGEQFFIQDLTMGPSGMLAWARLESIGFWSKNGGAPEPIQAQRVGIQAIAFAGANHILAACADKRVYIFPIGGKGFETLEDPALAK